MLYSWLQPQRPKQRLRTTAQQALSRSSRSPHGPLHYVRVLTPWTCTVRLTLVNEFEASRVSRYVDFAPFIGYVMTQLGCTRTSKSPRLSSRSASKTKRPGRRSLLPLPLHGRCVSETIPRSHILYCTMMHTKLSASVASVFTVLPETYHLSGLTTQSNFLSANCVEVE